MSQLIYFFKEQTHSLVMLKWTNKDIWHVSDCM